MRTEQHAPDRLQIVGEGTLRVDIGPVTLHIVASEDDVIVTPTPLGESLEAFDPSLSCRLQAGFTAYRELLREYIDVRSYELDDLP
jgi:hypothetical protein